MKSELKNREAVIVSTSILSIVVNLILALVKILIGTSVASIAIVSEGINNASDSATSLITIVGTKLSTKHPTQKHPFGFGRIEYFTSMVISILILFTGVELLKSSVELIFHPSQLKISYITLLIIAGSAIVKWILGVYIIKRGKEIDSGSLVAVGVECRNDSIMSGVTMISALVFLFTTKNIDAFAGIITALLVLKAGIDVIRETMDQLLGHSGDKELADQIYHMIRMEPVVINAADMMLHNYGPDSYSGSVNIEIDHNKTIGEVYADIHALQLKIMHEYHITMVFGIYAVDQDHELLKEMRKDIGRFVSDQEHVESYHALYIDEQNGDLYCDLIVDYQLEDWNKLRKDFIAYIEERYPGRRVELVIETKYV